MSFICVEKWCNLDNIVGEGALEIEIEVHVIISQRLGQRPSARVFPDDEKVGTFHAEWQAHQCVQIVMNWLFYLQVISGRRNKALPAVL